MFWKETGVALIIMSNSDSCLVWASLMESSAFIGESVHNHVNNKANRTGNIFITHPQLDHWQILCTTHTHPSLHTWTTDRIWHRQTRSTHAEWSVFRQVSVNLYLRNYVSNAGYCIFTSLRLVRKSAKQNKKTPKLLLTSDHSAALLSIHRVTDIEW